MIVRSHHDPQYTVMGNRPIEDDRLSFKALGVLAYLLTQTDENGRVDTNSRLLATTHRDGEYAVRQALSELEKLGYITRGWTRDPAGRFIRISEVRGGVSDE